MAMKEENYIYKGSVHFRGLNTGDELEVSMKEIPASEFNKLAVSPLEEWLANDCHMENIMIQNDVLSLAKEEGREECISAL